MLADMHGWEVVEAWPIHWLMTVPMRKGSGKLRRRGRYFGIKRRGRPGCLELKTESRRNHFAIFRDSTPLDRFQPLAPPLQSVLAASVGDAVMQATMQSIARCLYLCTRPDRFSALPSQRTFHTLSNTVDCLTFSDNASCVSDGLLVNCIEEFDSNCFPGLGQVDFGLGSKVFTEVQSHQSPNVKNRLTENVLFWEQMGASPWILRILREGYSLPFCAAASTGFFQKQQISS